MKTFFGVVYLIALVGPGFAAPNFDLVQTEPNVVFTREKTKVISGTPKDGTEPSP